MNRIGITTTIPVEVLFAARQTPVDLNNIFITHREPSSLVKKAEEDGLPRSLCSWVKGIYGAILENSDIDKVIAVTEGDCSNTLSMLSLLKDRGVEIIPFAYPFSRSYNEMNQAISKLESVMGVSRRQTEEVWIYLNSIREKALKLDKMTYEGMTVTGMENHIALISCSDFEGNPEEYSIKLDKLLEEAQSRKPLQNVLKLGYCGVPTIYSNLYQYLEEKGVRVVFNEMQRQFAMPYKTQNIVEQYLRYTYPYSCLFRIEDINEQIRIRKPAGLIHYVQSFCHHQIYHKKFKQSVKLPCLTLEGDKPGVLNEQNCIRIESFLEMLSLGCGNDRGGSMPNACCCI